MGPSQLFTGKRGERQGGSGARWGKSACTAVTEVKVRTDIYKYLEEAERVERSRWGNVPRDTSEAMGRNKKVRRRKMSIQPDR